MVDGYVGFLNVIEVVNRVYMLMKLERYFWFLALEIWIGIFGNCVFRTVIFVLYFVRRKFCGRIFKLLNYYSVSDVVFLYFITVGWIKVFGRLILLRDYSWVEVLFLGCGELRSCVLVLLDVVELRNYRYILRFLIYFIFFVKFKDNSVFSYV